MQFSTSKQALQQLRRALDQQDAAEKVQPEPDPAAATAEGKAAEGDPEEWAFGR